jgi:NAD-dependent SIR2 family protein deacetylase
MGDTALARAAEVLAAGRVVVLSGAGLSTESGIPDYRGPTGAARPATPMTYREFTRSADARRRYWARSHLGWPAMAAARPNAGHRAVARLQEHGLLAGVITQNVDGLHQVGGATEVTELHGALARVLCLDCGARSSRAELHARLSQANRRWQARAGVVNPDGDVVIAEHDVASFEPVACRSCGGVLKPDVVFFGESVPRDRVDACYALVEAANALLVVGSSLHVMSGYRFVLHCAKRQIPVVIVNQGPTRGDGECQVRVHERLGRALPWLAARLAA